MLTAKQQRFVKEYLVDLNATKACIRAGYSVKSADKIGSQLLGKSGVAAAIAAAQEKLAKKLEITQERVLREYAKLAFSDIRNVVRWGESVMVKMEDDGEVVVRNTLALVSSSDIDDDTAAAVEEVSEGKTGLKVKMHDKARALDALAKHLGLFERDNAQRAVTVVINSGDADIL